MRQFPSCVFLDKRVYIDWKAEGVGGEPSEGGDWWGVGFPRVHEYFVSKESALVWEGTGAVSKNATSL